MNHVPSRLTVFLSLFLTLLLGFLLGLVDRINAQNGGYSIWHFQLAFSKTQTLHVLNHWGAHGVALYRKTVWMDFIFPVAIAIFTRSLLLRKIVKRGSSNYGAFFLALPVCAVILDYLENAIQIYVSVDTALRPDFLFPIMSIVAIFKYVAFLLPVSVLIKKS